MKLIDKEKVEEILRNLWKEDDGHNSEHRICYNKALREVQYEIDTLEMKDIEQEKKKLIKKAVEWIDYGNKNGGCLFDGWERSFIKYLEK